MKKKLTKPRIAIIVLSVLALGGIIVQNVLVQSLKKDNSDSKESKSIAKNDQDWKKCWQLLGEATSDEDLIKAKSDLSALLEQSKQYKNDDPRLSALYNCLAQVCLKNGNYKDAEIAYRKVLEIDKKALGDSHPGIAIDLSNIAITCIKQKNFKEAENLAEDALRVNIKSLGDSHPSTASKLSLLASVYASQNLDKKAKEAINKALDVNIKSFGENDPIVATNLFNLALINLRLENFDKIGDSLDRVLTICSLNSAPRRQQLLSFLQSTTFLNNSFMETYTEKKPQESVKFPEQEFEKAKTLRKAGKSKEAEKLLLTHLNQARKSASGQIKLAKYLVRLNNVCFDQGKDGEAILFGEIASKIFDQQSDPDILRSLLGWNTGLHSYLAMSYQRHGQWIPADKHYERAIQYADITPNKIVSEKWKVLIQRGHKHVHSMLGEDKNLTATKKQKLQVQ